MQSITDVVHLATRNPAHQEGPTRPHEDELNYAQAGEDGTDHDACIWHEDNLIYQQLKINSRRISAGVCVTVYGHCLYQHESAQMQHFALSLAGV